MIANSESISSSHRLAFHLSLTLLFTIAKHLYLAFEDGSPILQQIIFYLILSLLTTTYTGLLPSMGHFSK